MILCLLLAGFWFSFWPNLMQICSYCFLPYVVCNFFVPKGKKPYHCSSVNQFHLGCMKFDCLDFQIDIVVFLHGGRFTMHTSLIFSVYPFVSTCYTFEITDSSIKSDCYISSITCENCLKRV